MNVEKMRRQLARAAPPPTCRRAGCNRAAHTHWHYLAGPGVPEEVVTVGSEREREISAQERMKSAWRGVGEQMDAALGFLRRPVSPSHREDDATGG